MKQFSNKVGLRFATTALFLVAVISMAVAQEPYRFIEGSTHSFSVTPSSENDSLVWGMYINPYKGEAMDPLAYSIVDNTSADVVVTFLNMHSVEADTVYLVVTETAPNGCSTKRALQILLEPNNMYFDFAALNASDCFNFDNNYFAEVQVGMNFLDRDGASDSPIPENRFPIKVKYTVENVTKAPGILTEGNNGTAVEFAYNPENKYSLEVSEAKGEVDETITYNLAIAEVIDRYGTAITHDENRKVQIRIMNHLPQSGDMDMALAYVVTPIIYNGGM